ncbi:ATP-grasp domain-containing protein [Sulfurimonas sp. SWIR-19]|uniref:ATP-grasp domain-containing protein n=1 Tax=Sulfurimonas sp. SWIR-19 TaxID=2878390 RepID=UPI001CF2B28C|nr:ATP-grasp domain-containing protein [Sulfurimonas sp. SWIR-19]UCN00488.1 ATP-grasp domain-containing protein [Sulfurimonas sp. SWIR-19]
MQKLLILGGSHRDIPLIQAAQALDYFVITLGNRDDYLGHNYSNKYYKIDFNDLEAVEAIYHKEKVSYLIPGCGEESYLSTVTLAHKLNIGNFDTLEVAQLVHNKWKFKEFCLHHNISTPKGIYYKDNLNNISLSFPIVVKPTKLSGGRGVQIVKNKVELTSALKESSAYSDEIFLEEFIEGRLIACSVILQNQKISYSFFGADESYLNSYLITTAYPISLEKTIRERLLNNIGTIATKLHLVDGMFHLQVIIKNNIPYIIDVTRRIAGDFYPKLIELCDNIKYSQIVIKSYTGIPLEGVLYPEKEQNFIIRHVVMPSKNGLYTGLVIDKILQQHIINKFELLKENTSIKDYFHTQIAIIFIKLPTKDINILNNINSLINPIIVEYSNEKQ